ncbi:Spo0B domain-containing protein [Paenibacillus aquistagni]|uniref:Sensor_kinase_SpoOB-type, alpha-helical domain n=1 Tax=Paenibacillus aquistagni TaxID=1852522 RepID=A0A1X7LVW6_9BACL|nr:Spo0B domain-containing protein [Paenibacillus aquistagni]SMG58046.1 Sensor_kinase_SpoOB-type, alpha-helical domain [Paenibacillus aquistagni]
MGKAWNVQWICGLLAFGCAVALGGWNLTMIWRILAMLLLIGSIGIGALLYCKARIASEKKKVHSAYQNALDVINHQRHDWMNELQLLYGYVRLKKFDKLPDCVESIKERMAEESRISKLGSPELVIYLLRNRVSGLMMPLEVEISDTIELPRIGADQDQLTDLIIDAVQVFRYAPKINGQHVSPLRISMSVEEDGLWIDFDYQGKLLRPDEVASQLQQMATERGARLKQLSNQEQDQTYRWIIPCTA